MAKPPHLVTAEHTLGNLDVERVPWYAADWLTTGHDGPALRELAGLDGTGTSTRSGAARSPTYTSSWTNGTRAGGAATRN
ncbi:hypothetical protein [Micromonospora endophytica]|uniref:Uncharacterized protein n=1 Tax=Micromonospora endophytica TaxID=515350 RepID=A0A2W2CM36_9ACTN|nr:hypothetical protein [Micromonospora endophytica]PZF99592.1 hypothetical protein C1I93_05245 [Micromonospora endophytica]RIW40812.1 hypothetical protein D3H59_28170 [Micromonospora endophytica]BCJ57014.1 hypothetical protein Jiend_04360 [Micromonospora endophytica]